MNTKIDRKKDMYKKPGNYIENYAYKFELELNFGQLFDY